jgi:hypothetical protein
MRDGSRGGVAHLLVHFMACAPHASIQRSTAMSQAMPQMTDSADEWQ